MERKKKIMIGYLTLMNIASSTLFYVDKQRAIHKQYRIPEKTLWATALLGGWVGGILGMSIFHHKSSKSSFHIPYYTLSFINGTFLYSFFTNRSIRSKELFTLLET